MDLLTSVKRIKSENDQVLRNQVIKDYVPFVINSISKLTNRYLETENDEEFLIGLSAFNEAIDRYDETKGGFLNFADLLIKSRVTDHLRKEQNHQKNIVYDESEVLNKEARVEEDLVLEIECFKSTLGMFGIDLENLVDQAPKHDDTRKKTIGLGKDISNEPFMVKSLYLKKRLPVSEVILKFKQSSKTVKLFRNFIVAVVVVFHEKLDHIASYMTLRGE